MLDAGMQPCIAAAVFISSHKWTRIPEVVNRACIDRQIVNACIDFATTGCTVQTHDAFSSRTPASHADKQRALVDVLRHTPCRRARGWA